MMEPNELVVAMRRLSKVGFGYDLTDEDKEALRQAANKIEDMDAFCRFVREILQESN